MCEVRSKGKIAKNQKKEEKVQQSAATRNEV
jgi:hypothetical protein